MFTLHVYIVRGYFLYYMFTLHVYIVRGYFLYYMLITAKLRCVRIQEKCPFLRLFCRLAATGVRLFCLACYIFTDKTSLVIGC